MAVQKTKIKVTSALHLMGYLFVAKVTLNKENTLVYFKLAKDKKIALIRDKAYYDYIISLSKEESDELMVKLSGEAFRCMARGIGFYKETLGDEAIHSIFDLLRSDGITDDKSEFILYRLTEKYAETIKESSEELEENK